MSKRLDLGGQKFGRLTVINFAEIRKKRTYWNCKCDCGNTVVVKGDNLKKGNTQSCGCFKKEIHTKHGKWLTPEYRAWQHMIQRCTNKKDKFYKDYGERGITVCDEWRSFVNFYTDMGERPKGMSLERKNNNEGYNKENCVWATMQEQQNNTRQNRHLTLGGRRQTISQWSKELGIGRLTITSRLKLGWSAERALTQKVSIRSKRQEAIINV